MKFKARVPMKLPKEKTLGLILAFHPHGGNENSMVNWPSKTFLERQGAVDDYVIIGLKSRGLNGYKEHLGDWEKADHAPSYETFQWAMKTYPIDLQVRRIHPFLAPTFPSNCTPPATGKFPSSVSRT